MTGTGPAYDGWAREVLTSSPDGLAVIRAELDGSGAVTALTVEYLNPAASSWWGIPAGAAVGRELRELLDPRRGSVLWDLSAAVVRTGRRQRVRVHQSSEPGQVVLDLVMDRMRDRFVIVTFRDVSRTAEDEQLMAAAYEQVAAVQATLQAALDATTDAFAVYDVGRDDDDRVLSLRLLQINAAGARGLEAESREDLIGKDLRDFYPAAERTGLWDAVQAAATTRTTQSVRLHEFGPCGTWMSASDYTVAPAGRGRIVITWHDASSEASRERELACATDAARFAATHDPLTGLANRTLLHERMVEACGGSSDQDRIAIAYVDLDRFKRVNDTYGHAAGDDLLRAVASRLREQVRPEDTVARVGGDEFVLLLRRLPPTWAAAGFVARARSSVEQPVSLAAGVLQPRVSFGVVFPPSGSRDVEQMLCRADYAMYQDKEVRHSAEDRDRTDPTSAERRPALAPGARCEPRESGVSPGSPA